MALDSKELFEYLNIEPVEKLEDFRAKFEPVYVKKAAIKEDKELISSLVGKVTGSLQTAFIRDLKKEGVEFSEGEVKGLELEKVWENGLSKLKSNYTSQIEELKSKQGKPSEEYEALKEKYTKVEGKANDYKRLVDEMKEQFAQKEQGYQSQIKSVKLDTKKADLFKQAKYKTGATEVEKEGYNAILHKKYKFELDESGENLEILNSKGERIPNPKKNGEFKSPFEILEEEGRAAGVWESNPIASKGRVQTPMSQHNRIESPVLNGARPRVLSPAAITNEGK